MSSVQILALYQAMLSQLSLEEKTRRPTTRCVEYPVPSSRISPLDIQTRYLASISPHL